MRKIPRYSGGDFVFGYSKYPGTVILHLANWGILVNGFIVNLGSSELTEVHLISSESIA